MNASGPNLAFGTDSRGLQGCGSRPLAGQRVITLCIADIKLARSAAERSGNAKHCYLVRGDLSDFRIKIQTIKRATCRSRLNGEEKLEAMLVSKAY